MAWVCGARDDEEEEVGKRVTSHYPYLRGYIVFVIGPNKTCLHRKIAWNEKSTLFLLFYTFLLFTMQKTHWLWFFASIIKSGDHCSYASVRAPIAGLLQWWFPLFRRRRVGG